MANKVIPIVLIRQFLKFSFVGVLNTIITLSTIFIFMKLFNTRYLTANIIGYILGFANSFILNKKWTFHSNKSCKREIISFIVIFLICYELQLGLLILLKEVLLTPIGIAQVLAMVFYTGLNFLGNKFVTFRAEEIRCLS
ncbi:MAG: GtrA family protein [Candidatus Jettenia sp.]|nr:MAG: GtrA family protein [Candidatus Jettenia sp.]